MHFREYQTWRKCRINLRDFACNILDSFKVIVYIVNQHQTTISENSFYFSKHLMQIQDIDTYSPGINISHLGKRKIIFKYALSGGYLNSLEGRSQNCWFGIPEACYTGSTPSFFWRVQWLILRVLKLKSFDNSQSLAGAVSSVVCFWFSWGVPFPLFLPEDSPCQVHQTSWVQMDDRNSFWGPTTPDVYSGDFIFTLRMPSESQVTGGFWGSKRTIAQNRVMANDGLHNPLHKAGHFLQRSVGPSKIPIRSKFQPSNLRISGVGGAVQLGRVNEHLYFFGMFFAGPENCHLTTGRLCFLVSGEFA